MDVAASGADGDTERRVTNGLARAVPCVGCPVISCGGGCDAEALQSAAAVIEQDAGVIDLLVTDDKAAFGDLKVMTTDAEIAERIETVRALATGVHFTRDLVNEPSNVLTTTEFAARLEALRALDVNVEVLEEDELEALGMRTLLAVGQGSVSPSKVVVMEWAGGGSEAPVALIGKGVVFDTGGISLKPAAGMEDMTMDMGGAGTVAGAMQALAMRKARAKPSKAASSKAAIVFVRVRSPTRFWSAATNLSPSVRIRESRSRKPNGQTRSFRSSRTSAAPCSISANKRIHTLRLRPLTSQLS